MTDKQLQSNQLFFEICDLITKTQETVAVTVNTSITPSFF